MAAYKFSWSTITRVEPVGIRWVIKIMIAENRLIESGQAGSVQYHYLIVVSFYKGKYYPHRGHCFAVPIVGLDYPFPAIAPGWPRPAPRQLRKVGKWPPGR